ncbi:MAG: nicotinate-nucleotide adenylyltransferase [Nitrococcus sp.]|nr:nicotinate-nucleotide adenylyltransferase [Nitrococcus sp.]
MTRGNLAPAAPIGILGGTFDPVHHGHLRPAIELLERLGLVEMRLVPGHLPPHRRAPRTPSHQRLRLLQLAVAGAAGLAVDDRELRRGGYSYTVDTLHELRAELGERPLCFVLGSDAFLGLPSWYRWRDLENLTHLVVMQRPGHELRLGAELIEWAAPRQVSDAAALHACSSGLILYQEPTALPISASGIRRLIAQGRSARFLMPDSVWQCIASEGLYGYPQV